MLKVGHKNVTCSLCNLLPTTLVAMRGAGDGWVGGGSNEKEEQLLFFLNGRNESELIHCLDCEFVTYERELVLCTALSTSMLAAL